MGWPNISQPMVIAKVFKMFSRYALNDTKALTKQERLNHFFLNKVADEKIPGKWKKTIIFCISLQNVRLLLSGLYLLSNSLSESRIFIKRQSIFLSIYVPGLFCIFPVSKGNSVWPGLLSNRLNDLGLCRELWELSLSMEGVIGGWGLFELFTTSC